MQDIKVSVIVPIYNTEKFLRKCIESIVNQTLEEIEIILINDGSTDNSHIICEEYSRKYPEKIRYINNKNIGCSATRNLGISLAKGEYITFVDSDDYIEREMYKEMYEKVKAEEAEIIISGVKYIKIPEKIERIVTPQIFSKNISEYLKERNKTAFCWNKLFKRSLILQKNIKFPENTHNTEDLVFSFKAIVNSKKNCYLEKSYYNYIHHGSNSIFSLEKKLGVFISFEILYSYLLEKNYIKNKKIMKRYFENFNTYAIKGIFFSLLNPKLVSEEEYKKYNQLFYEELKKIHYLPLKSKFLVYYYREVVLIIRKFRLYNILKKIKNKVRKK